MEEQELNAENITYCQTSHILKQKVYKQNKTNQVCSDIVLELVIQIEAWRSALRESVIQGYIQGIEFYPFYVSMYSEEKIRLCLSLIKNSPYSALHFH